MASTDQPGLDDRDAAVPLFWGVDPADLDAVEQRQADLDALSAAGFGEGDDDDPHVPPGLLDLGEAIKARETGLL